MIDARTEPATGMRRTSGTRHYASARLVVVFAGSLAIACGKSGPPLPPLVRLPAPPADLVAERRSTGVTLQFTVPNANTDGSRPANIDRVEVYAVTGAGAMTDDAIVKQGTRVATVDVKAPRDPDRTVGPDESEAEVEPLEGNGLDQGARARVEESLTEAALAPVKPRREGRAKKRDDAPDDDGRPLLGPAGAALSRTYLLVGVSTRGRRGPPSKRVSVPLVSVPPAPAKPDVSYVESAVTVTWMGVAPQGLVQEPDTAGVLPSTPVGVSVPTLGYHVYELSPQEPTGSGTRLTTTALSETKYEDQRMTWGARRCYTVRAVAVVDTLALEGDAAPAACTTLMDTFPPAAPKGLQSVAHEGSISLIWDPNTEPDLAGYLVFRGSTPDNASQQMTPAAIEQAMFTDVAAAGIRYVYLVKAIDKAGNVSAPSAPAEGTAR